MKLPFILFLFLAVFTGTGFSALSQVPKFQYSLSFPNPETNSYHVTLESLGWDRDSIRLKLPKWMPGYYQLMPYAKSIENFSAKNKNGKNIAFTRLNKNTWQLTGIRNQTFSIAYDVKTHRKFVANSFVDSTHAYIVPGNSFLYAKDFLQTPVSVQVNLPPAWPDVVTGLAPVNNNRLQFKASNFDILYDSPLLMGDLETLPSFDVHGIPHRFIGYKMGDFNEQRFMNLLEKVVASAANLMGDIPFNRYTFIGIGPGRGGIEHLNNTTVSFSGSQLKNEEGMNRMLHFLAHEYFHHYNAKRIRPVELGPFNYQKENRTYLLWISEGLTSYYEYLIVKRAGITNSETLFSHLESHINTVENNPGRLHQSLAQASYRTWEDGPFGNMGEEENKTITYYQKGPIIGLLLDFSIRHATQNQKSLDDVMRFLYRHYYKEKKRGFTGAEFQQACERIAGTHLDPVFEYVYTTKEIDYNHYLNFAGLQLKENKTAEGKKVFNLAQIEQPNELQQKILKSWLGN